MNNEFVYNSYYDYDILSYKNESSSRSVERILKDKLNLELYKRKHPHVITVEDEYEIGWGQYVDRSSEWKIRKSIMKKEYRLSIVPFSYKCIRWLFYIYVLWFVFWLIYGLL